MPQPDSSPESAAANEASATDIQDVNNSESSSDSEGVETPSYLDVVEAALEDPEKEESPTSENGEEQAEPEGEGSGKSEDEESEDDEADEQEGEITDLTDEEKKVLSVKSQKRFRTLVAQRDDAKGQVESLRPRAEQMDRVTGFMREHNISPEEFDNALHVTRLVNTGDYGEALKVLTPIYRELAAKAGEVLPEDLQEEVRLGKISEPRARELSRARANAQSAEERERRSRETASQDEEQQRISRQINDAVSAVDDWAKAKAGSDPDWSEKHEEVAEQVQLELDKRGPDGFPKSKQEAIEIAESALKKVEKRHKRFRPKPKEHRTVTDEGASPKAKSKPKSFMEAIDQALEES